MFFYALLYGKSVRENYDYNNEIRRQNHKNELQRFKCVRQYRGCEFIINHFISEPQLDPSVLMELAAINPINHARICKSSPVKGEGGQLTCLLWQKQWMDGLQSAFVSFDLFKSTCSCWYIIWEKPSLSKSSFCRTFRSV